VLSNLPKLADRRFILGFFLPSMLFALAMVFLCDNTAETWKDLLGKEPTSTARWLIGIWVFGVLLLALNDSLWRIFSGQRWPLSHLERRKAEKQTYAREARTRAVALYKTRVQHELPANELGEYLRLRRELFQFVPTPDSRVLPTRFGNAMRA
jgi:hypothetical protein